MQQIISQVLPGPCRVAATNRNCSRVKPCSSSKLVQRVSRSDAAASKPRHPQMARVRFVYGISASAVDAASINFLMSEISFRSEDSQKVSVGSLWELCRTEMSERNAANSDLTSVANCLLSACVFSVKFNASLAVCSTRCYSAETI